jgi:hypothetical protein
VLTRAGVSEVVSVSSASIQLDPTEAAYGSWSFWAKKANTFTQMIIHPISSVASVASGTGYYLNFASGVTNRLIFTQTGVANLIDLNPAPVDLTVWRHYHLTRRYDGYFELFIDGVLVGSATQNTVRTSKYMTIYLSGADGCAVALSDIHGGHAFTKYLGVVPPNMG